MFYREILERNGVVDADDCMAWAFGESYRSMLIKDCDDKWRTKHPNKKPIYGHTSIEDGFKIVAEEYLNEQKNRRRNSIYS